MDYLRSGFFPPSSPPFIFMLNITLVCDFLLPQMRGFKIKEFKYYPELICTADKIRNPLKNPDVHYGKKWVGL